jgi:hypothetical protein
MKVTLARFIEVPVCANCCDYVDFPSCKLIARNRGWVHFSTGSVRRQASRTTTLTTAASR